MVGGHTHQRGPLISPRDEPRGCYLRGGPERPPTSGSVTHLPLSFRGAERPILAGSVPTGPVISPLLRHCNNNASVGFPFRQHTNHGRGGNQRPLLNIREDWPELNPRLFFSQGPSADRRARCVPVSDFPAGLPSEP